MIDQREVLTEVVLTIRVLLFAVVLYVQHDLRRRGRPSSYRPGKESRYQRRSRSRDRRSRSRSRSKERKKKAKKERKKEKKRERKREREGRSSSPPPPGPSAAVQAEERVDRFGRTLPAGRERSPSVSGSSRSSHSRSRSRSPSESRKRYWDHDKFPEVAQAGDDSPGRRKVPIDYVPPEPTWKSKAGGVYIPIKKK